MSQQWRKLPKDFLKRLPTLVPKENIKTILDAYTKKRPTTIRVNTLKTSVAMLLSYFDKQQILYTKSDISPHSFIIHNQLTDIQKLDAYTNGLFYVQSLSSQLPALILNPQPGDRVLDIAAAPGSKTSQMSAMMDNTGEIVANDNSRIRGYKLQKNLDTLGVMNTKVTISPGQTLWKQYENETHTG